MSAPSTPAASERPALGLATWSLLVLSATTLAISYGLPTVVFEKAFSEPEIYSIWGGIAMLWGDGDRALAALVFVFSMVFPVGKLAVLALLCWRSRRAAEAPRRALHWVELLGKWSMLDVLLIGGFVGSIRLQMGGAIQLASGASRPGIHVFAAAIVLSMLSTWLAGRWLCGGRAHPARDPDDPRRWSARLVSTLTAAALVAALAQPLVEVSAAFLFRNVVELPAMAWRLAEGSERLLGGLLLAVLLAAPALRSLTMLRLRWLGGGRRAARLAMTLDEWAMLDVFALGLVILFVKLDQLADVATRPGFWWIFVAAAAAQLDAWILRREALATGDAEALVVE